MSLRQFLAVTFLLGSIGLATELVLIGHLEDIWQQIPFALMAAGTAMLVWDWARPTVWSLKLVRVTMLLLVAGGLLGLALHYQSNAEFELEMYPDLRGLSLVREALTGALPALAPGALIQLGLIGLAYTFRENPL